MKLFHRLKSIFKSHELSACNNIFSVELPKESQFLFIDPFIYLFMFCSSGIFRVNIFAYFASMVYAGF